jgi:TetR/AcrR family transcriptional repressor of nem operon
MKLTKKQAAENRQSIINAAGQLFRERGFDGVGLDDIMKTAGFTHGGFYNHFSSKEMLTATATLSGIRHSNSVITQALSQQTKSNESPLLCFFKRYLSKKHRDDLSDGCTIASLAGDAARQNEQVQASFAQGVNEELDILASYVAAMPAAGTAASARESAIHMLVETTGAIILARAVAKGNPSLSEEILETIYTDFQIHMKHE